MNLSTVKWAQWDKTQSRELLVCSYVCASHCAQLLHTILHRTDLIVFPPYPPDNHHCSDDVYLREGGSMYRNMPYTFRYVYNTRQRKTTRGTASDMNKPTRMEYWIYTVSPRGVRLLKFRTLDWPLLTVLLLIWSCRLLALTELLAVLWLVLLSILRLFHDFSDRHAMVLEIHGRLTAEVLWPVTHDVRPTPGGCSESCYTRGYSRSFWTRGAMVCHAGPPGGIQTLPGCLYRTREATVNHAIPAEGIAGRSVPGRGRVKTA